jgi:hypothetical protein
MSDGEEIKRDTLFSLLTDLERADGGLVEIDPEQHKDLLLSAELKIDAYKYIFQKYDSRITEVQAEIDELTAIKRTLQRRQESLRTLLLWIFKQKGIEKFPGVKYTAKFCERKKVSIKVEPDAKIYLAFPNLVKRSYVWDKAAFAREFKKNPDVLSEFATEEKSEFIQFVLNRSIDDE